MAAIQKNFVVKKGLEVNSSLIVANSDTNRVGIATTTPRYLFHINGGIGVTFSTVTGILTTTTLNTVSNILINGIAGSVGQYIGYTTTGLSWASPAEIGSVRNSTSFTANPNQTDFSVVYEVGLLDVYVNGVKLSESEFTANDGIIVTLSTPCFGGESIEFIAYANTSLGIGVSGIPGINVKDNTTLIGNPLSIVNLSFVGASITTDGTGVGVTVNLGGTWNKNTTGINTFSNVGIGTTTADYALTVAGDVKVGSGNTQGVILTSPNGTKYRLKVDNTGALSTTAV